MGNSIRFGGVLLLAMVLSGPVPQADGAPYATVVLVRGQASFTVPPEAKAVSLKKDLELPLGARIETGRGSFVRIRLADQSLVSIGPGSKIDLLEAHGGDASMLDLLSGRIRAAVTKAPKDRVLEKMIVRTRSAAMGIRGTDFIVTFAPKTERTTLTTVHGLVAMAALAPSASAEEALRGRVLLVGAGTFAAVSANRLTPEQTSPIPASRLQRLKDRPDLLDTPADLAGSGNGRTELPDLLDGELDGGPGQRRFETSDTTAGDLTTGIQNTLGNDAATGLKSAVGGAANFVGAAATGAGSAVSNVSSGMTSTVGGAATAVSGAGGAVGGAVNAAPVGALPPVVSQPVQNLPPVGLPKLPPKL